MPEKKKFLYNPQTPEPTPNSSRIYEIADVNPKWIRDILGEDWEYTRNPLEITFSATDRDKGLSAEIRFTSEVFHIFSMDIEGNKHGINPSLTMVGQGQVEFPYEYGSSKSFVVITRDGRTRVNLLGDGTHFSAETRYANAEDEHSISRIPFPNPKPPKKK